MSCRSHRIVWLLEELGIEYEIKKYQRTKEQLAPKELEAVHPLGKSPIITDGGRVIAETGEISIEISLSCLSFHSFKFQI
jgi:glutathione S-transferase